MSLADLIGVGDSKRIKRLADHYRNTFSGPSAEAVMQDLADVCHATVPVPADTEDGRVDPHGTLVNAGKQAVFIHIRNMIRLSDASLETIEEMFGRQDDDI